MGKQRWCLKKIGMGSLVCLLLMGQSIPALASATNQTNQKNQPSTNNSLVLGMANVPYNGSRAVADQGDFKVTTANMNNVSFTTNATTGNILALTGADQEYIIEMKDQVTSTSDRIVIAASGVKVTIKGLTIDANTNGSPMLINSGATTVVNLEGENSFTTSNDNSAALQNNNPADGSLVIKSDNNSNGLDAIDGSLIANNSGNGAGIGGGGYSSGNVEISGGSVQAYSTHGAGVGSGAQAPGTVKISGGSVQASSTYGAGIGGGSFNSGTVEISGGSVNANSYDGAGIGGGTRGGTGIVQISDGDVQATSTYGGAGIGDGRFANAAGEIKISGGTITAISSNNRQGGYGIGSDYASNEAGIQISGGSVKASGTTGDLSANPTSDGTELVYLNRSFTYPDGQPIVVNNKDFKISTSHPNSDQYLYLYLPNKDDAKIAVGNQMNVGSLNAGAFSETNKYAILEAVISPKVEMGNINLLKIDSYDAAAGYTYSLSVASSSSSDYQFKNWTSETGNITAPTESTTTFKLANNFTDTTRVTANFLEVRQLKEAITKADGLKETTYTEKSWTELQETLVRARELLSTQSSEQSDVNQMVSNLNAAIDNLVLAVNKTALQELVDSTEKLVGDSYTSATWAAVQASLEAAQTILDRKDAEQREVDEMVTTLKTSIDNLILRVIKTALQKVVNDIDELDENSYTPKSWQALQEVLEEAQTILDGGDANQDEVDQMVVTLNGAIEKLILKANKTALQKVVDDIDKLDGNSYTPKSWQELQSIVPGARTILSDENARQSTVNGMVTDLKEAMDHLILKADKTKLQDLVTSTNKLDENSYSSESWQALQTALVEAQTILDDANTEQSTVNGMVTKLQSVIDGLIEKPVEIPVDKSVLQGLVDRGNAFSEEPYTVESWQVFQGALTEAQTLLENSEASQEAVDNMITKLQAAMDALVEAPLEANTLPLYRLYNPNTGEHFYTLSGEERYYLFRMGWQNEGIGWKTPDSGEEVFRLYNANTGEHMYTLDRGEYDHLAEEGWTQEDRAFYSAETEELPIYRLYNPNQFAFNHHYSQSGTERDWLVGLGWKYELVAFYGK